MERVLCCHPWIKQLHLQGIPKHTMQVSWGFIFSRLEKFRAETTRLLLSMLGSAELLFWFLPRGNEVLLLHGSRPLFPPQRALDLIGYSQSLGKKPCAPSHPGPPSWACLETNDCPVLLCIHWQPCFSHCLIYTPKGVPVQDRDSVRMIRDRGRECRSFRSEVPSVQFVR